MSVAAPPKPSGIAQETLDRLRSAVGPVGFTEDPGELAPHLREERGQFFGATPLLLRPQTTAQVAGIVGICAETATPIVPQGGNTGLVGGGIPSPDGGQILVNLGRMNRVRDLDALGGTITVEAGCILGHVQRAAEQAGRLFPLSLGAEGTCQIGGNLATNAGGTQVVRYGTARALTLGLEVVLPDGRVWDSLRAVSKDNTGYDLKQLFIGAEGTLCIITAAVLRLFPLPRQAVTSLAAVPDPDRAIRLYAHMRTAGGERMTAAELMSARAMDFAARHIAGVSRPFASPVPWSVLCEFHGGEGDDLRAAVESGLATAIEAGIASDAVIAADAAQAERLWRLRESIPEAQRHEGGSIKNDISVPPGRVPAFLREADAAIEAAYPRTRVVAFGHLGDGNIHYNLSQPEGANRAAFLAEWGQLTRIVHDLAVAHGGSISAEHGIGQLKRAELVRVRSNVELDLMRTLKAALDPAGILNPGKLL